MAEDDTKSHELCSLTYMSLFYYKFSIIFSYEIMGKLTNHSEFEFMFGKTKI